MQELAAELIGQCVKDQDSVCEEMSIPDTDHWTPADHAAFDMLCFLCASCGWWYGIEDLGEGEDDLKCLECSEEDNE